MRAYSLSTGRWHGQQIRSTKSEIRNKFEIQIPKPQKILRYVLTLRFGLLVSIIRFCFGFRDSDFGFSVARVRLGLLILLAAVSPDFAADEKPSPAPTPPPFTNSIGMKLVGIPAGNYLCYGRDIQPEFLFPKPKPGFNVKIERKFYLGATEVTQAQYQKVMGANPSAGKPAKECPVNRVSWNDTMEFCRKLSELPKEKEAGRVYSLPSEREWQYAARAGSEFLFPYGDDNEMRVAEVAVCRDIYTDALPQGVQAVAKKKPNAWGLYDVLGNVWEWVLDAWSMDKKIEAYPPPSAVPPSASSAALDKGEDRIIVGGGWDNDFRMCNLAARYSAPPTRVANNLGFRVRCLVNKPGN